MFLISPYGHIISCVTNKKYFMGRNLKIRYQPIGFDNNLIFHIKNDKQTWLECRNILNFDKVFTTKKYDNLYNFFLGHPGTSPVLTEDSIICGFGGCLACFSHDGREKWEFKYPNIDALKGEPAKIIADGKVLYQTTSEVDIASDLYYYSNYLYFVLAEHTHHIAYVTKINIEDGKVIWASRIDGFSAGYHIADVTSKGIILQNGTWIWIISQDGTIKTEADLDIDCASCSNLIKLNDSNYILLADLGVHEVVIKDIIDNLDIDELFNDTIKKGKPQIFFCYARDDMVKVDGFYNKLMDNGLKPWMDKKDILPGEQWETSIKAAIRKANFFIVCLTNKSVNKRGFLQKEIKDALEIWKEKIEMDIYLIPVRFENCVVPENLKKFQWVDLFLDEGFSRLLKAINVGIDRYET